MKPAASQGSVAVGGDNSGSLFNTVTGDHSPVSISVTHEIARDLPSFLGRVIVHFSQQELAAYAKGERRE